MAIDVTTYSGKEVQVQIAQEATFGTAVTNAGFILSEFGSVSYDPGLTRSVEAKQRASRVAYEGDAYVSQTGGTRTITISDIIFRKENIAEFLYAVLQNVTEGASTPYQKTFNHFATAPEFGGNAGYFCTIGILRPGTNTDIKFTSCICKSLTLKYDGVGGDGRLTGDAEFISGFALDPSAAFTNGAVNPQAYLNFNTMSIKQIGGNDAVIYNFDVTINNNAVRVGNDSSGDAENYFIGTPEMEITWNCKAKFDTTTDDMADDLIGGTVRALQLAIGSDDTDGHVYIYLYDNVLESAADDIGMSEGLAVDLSGKTVYDGSNTSYVKVADAIDQSW